MKILFVNNDGGGFADYIDIPHGTTVQELFEREMRQAKAENYLIRVNRQPRPATRCSWKATASHSRPRRSRESQVRSFLHAA